MPNIFANYFEDEDEEELTPSQRAAEEVQTSTTPEPQEPDNIFSDYFTEEPEQEVQPQETEIIESEPEPEREGIFQRAKGFISGIVDRFKKKEPEETELEYNPPKAAQYPDTGYLGVGDMTPNTELLVEKEPFNPVREYNQLLNNGLLKNLEDRKMQIQKEKAKDDPNYEKIDRLQENIREIDNALSLPVDKFGSTGKKYRAKAKFEFTRDFRGGVATLANVFTGLVDYATKLSENDPVRKLSEERAKELEKKDPERARKFRENIGLDEEPVSRTFSNRIKTWANDVAPSNPDVLDKIGNGIVSTVPFLVTSILTKGGALAMSAMESAGEAGSVYEENRDQGLSIEDSSLKADKNFVFNMIIGYFTDKIAFFSDEERILKKAINGMSGEGVQEMTQQMNSNYFSGRPFWEGVLESGGIGAISGGTISVAMPSGESFTKQIEPVEVTTEPAPAVQPEGTMQVEEREERFEEVELPTEEAISTREQDLRETYSQNRESVEEAMGNVFMEMDAAEAGERIFLEPDPTAADERIIGISSTFPDWVPADLRSKALFENVLEGITDIENITYPPANRTAQRELYDYILEEVDSRSGVDTSDIRSDILRMYESEETTQTITRSIEGREAVSEQEQEREQVAFKPSDTVTVYRGTDTEAGRGGNYYSTNRQFAEEFSGGMEENLLSREIPLNKIYRPDILPEATNESQVQEAIDEAREAGYSAVFVDEGTPFGEPVESVFVIDQEAFSQTKETTTEEQEEMQKKVETKNKVEKYIKERDLGIVKFREYIRDEAGRFSEITLENFSEVVESVSTEASITLLNLDTETYRAAWQDVVEGQRAVSELPILVEVNPAGGLEIIDGNHRVAQARINEDTTVRIITDEALYRRLSEIEETIREGGKEKFRVKDDVERVLGKEITEEQEREIIELNERLFGDEDVRIVLQIMANNKALGSTRESMVEILAGQADPKDTFYHESVHKHINIFTTTQEQAELFTEGLNKYDTDNLSEVEEKIAEDFIDYAKSREGVVGRIKLLFDKVLNRINTYLDNQSAIDELYADILEPAPKKLTKTAQRKAARARNATRTETTAGKVLPFIGKDFKEAVKEGNIEPQVDRVIKQSEISKNLAEDLGFPIRFGRFNVKKAAGIYKHAAKVVRSKWGYNVEIISHEAAHFLQDEFAAFSQSRLEPYKSELKAISEDSGYGSDEPLVEGFAEYVRYWITQPRKASSIAPKMTEFFEEQLKGYPDAYDALSTAKRDFKAFQAQPATNKIESQISYAEDIDGENIIDRLSNKWNKLQTGFVDDLYPLKKFTDILRSRGKKLDPIEDPYVAARLNRGVTGKADTFLNEGTIGRKFWKKVDGKVKMDFKGKSLKEILKPIDSREAIRDFSKYLVSRRVIELNDRDIETGMTVEDARATKKYYESRFPVSFKKAAKELGQYQDSLLDYLKESGVISSEMQAKMKEANKMYVPFYRMLENLDNSGFMSTRMSQSKTATRKIKGSQLEVIDPLESIVKNTYSYIQIADTNNILLQMADAAAKHPDTARLFEKVDPDIGLAATATVADLKLDPEIESMIEKALGEDAEFDIFRPMQFPKQGNTIVLLRDGKKEFYEVDKDIYASLTNMNREDINMVVRLLSKPASWLRASATLSPEFIARNPVRDQWTAWFFSKSGYFPLVDLPRGMFELFTKGDAYKLWKAGGGEHSTLVALDRVTNKETLKEVLKDNGAKALDYVKNPVEGLRVLSEFMEVSTRLGEMKRALSKTGDPVASTYATRNVTLDFNKMGAYMRAINMIIPFSSANIQGHQQFFKAMKENPGKSFLKGTIGITLPTLLLYALNRDDERWKEIPQWQKDLFWIVMTDKQIFRIPKPFIVGQLFGSLPERIWEYIDEQDPKLMDEFAKNFINTSTPSVMPTALLPFIEGIANYNFFLGHRLMSEGTAKLPKKAQYTHYTSEVAKKVGELTKQSPIVIDNFINAWFGGLGKSVIRQLDPILEDTEIALPEKTLADIPVTKAFVVRRPKGSAGVSVDRFYDRLEEFGRHEAYLKKQMETGNLEEAKTYANKYGISLHYDSSYESYFIPEARVYRRSSKVLSELRNLQKQVRQSKKLDSKEKREKIEKLDDMLTKVSKATMKAEEDMQTDDFSKLKIKVNLGDF